jgi:tetratricopeptide (TPR) repeat protein
MSLLGKMLGFGRNAHYDKGIRLFDQGLYEEAVAEFDLARQAKGGRVDSLTERLSAFYTAESYAHLGHTALKQEQWSRAETCFARALAVHPHYADLHFYYALAIRAGGRYAEARDAMQKALEINPRFAKARFYAGLIAYELGEREDGLTALNSAIELEPGFRTETFACALGHHASENFDAALQAFEQVSLTEVDDILFHYKLADDMYRRGMYAEAIGEYQKALELNPNYADIRNHLGITYSAHGKPAEAIEEFRSALRINPRFVDAMVNLALCLRDTGEIDEASTLFERVLELEPDNVIARANGDNEAALSSRRAA